MPVMTEVAVPTEVLTPTDAREYLLSFLHWVHDFFETMKVDSTLNGTYAHLFDAEQIAYFPAALEEIESDGIFERATGAVSEISMRSVVDHGLYGNQLIFKLSNVNYRLRGFFERPRRATLRWLLDTIDDILESLLDGVPGGGAIVELKKALGGALVDDSE